MGENNVRFATEVEQSGTKVKVRINRVPREQGQNNLDLMTPENVMSVIKRGLEYSTPKKVRVNLYPETMAKDTRHIEKIEAAAQKAALAKATTAVQRLGEGQNTPLNMDNAQVIDLGTEPDLSPETFLRTGGGLFTSQIYLQAPKKD